MTLWWNSPKHFKVKAAQHLHIREPRLLSSLRSLRIGISFLQLGTKEQRVSAGMPTMCASCVNTRLEDMWRSCSCRAAGDSSNRVLTQPSRTSSAESWVESSRETTSKHLRLLFNSQDNVCPEGNLHKFSHSAWQSNLLFVSFRCFSVNHVFF